MKHAGKVTLFMAVMVFVAVFSANALEGVVLRTISSPTESRVMLDTNGDGQADMYISIPRNVDPKPLYEWIGALFDRGSRVEIDDDYILNDGNTNFAYLGGILSIDEINPVDTTPGGGGIFEAAVEKKREEYRQTRSGR